MTNTFFKCFINCPVGTAISPQKTLVRTAPWRAFCLLYGPQRAGVKKASCRELLRLLKFPQLSHRSSPTLLPGFFFFFPSLPTCHPVSPGMPARTMGSLSLNDRVVSTAQSLSFNPSGHPTSSSFPGKEAPTPQASIKHSAV